MIRQPSLCCELTIIIWSHNLGRPLNSSSLCCLSHRCSTLILLCIGSVFMLDKGAVDFLLNLLHHGLWKAKRKWEDLPNFRSRVGGHGGWAPRQHDPSMIKIYLGQAVDITVSREEYDRGLNGMCLLTGMKVEEQSIIYSWPMSGEVFLSFPLNPSEDLSYFNHARVLLSGGDAGVFANMLHWTFPRRYGTCQRVCRFCSWVLCARSFQYFSVPHRFLQEWPDSGGMAPESAGMTGIRRNGTGMAPEWNRNSSHRTSNSLNLPYLI